MPYFWSENGFRARMNEIKSGIPCSEWGRVKGGRVKGGRVKGGRVNGGRVDALTVLAPCYVLL